MADTPTCSCGCSCGGAGSAEIPVERYIFPCGGVENTGLISNGAAIHLSEEGYGDAACTALLATGVEEIVAAVKDADEVLILDGCPARCAGTLAESLGITATQTIVVTELGITKRRSRNYSEDEIETVVSAVWDGKGRTE